MPVYNMDEFVSIFGARQTYSPLYDWLDVFFREGGNRAYVSRVVGPAATSGSLNLLDAGAAIALVATGIGPGAWSAGYKVQVAAGVGAGTFVIRVLDATNAVLEDSGDLLDTSAAVQWSQFSDYIRLTQGASVNDPAVLAATALSAGNDDRLNATDASYQAALDRFSKDLGPGQVALPGRTSDTAHGQIVAHANARNRVALLDLPDVAVQATLIASVAAARSNPVGGFGPWITVPGLISGQFRVVPPSALIAGLVARNDPSLGANHPSAGRFGVSRFAYDLSQIDWDDTARTALNNSGVNVIRRFRGQIVVYGWRSTSLDPNWTDFGNSRLFMAMASQLDRVAENFLFDEIDGQDGGTIQGFHTGIAGVMLDFFNNGQLFGNTAAEAFNVDTGPSVNTLATIAANELHAVVSVRMATMAEFVQVEVVKHPVTEAI
jgi:phage tail sheath protein FI